MKSVGTCSTAQPGETHIYRYITGRFAHMNPTKSGNTKGKYTRQM